MNEQEFAELSAAYALNALTADDRRAFETAWAQHPEWSSHVQVDADTVAQLAQSIDPVAPPAYLRSGILARIAETSQADAADDSSATEEDFAAAGPAPVEPIDDRAPAPVATPANRRVGRRWFALAASVVLIAALGFGTVVVTQQLNRPAAVIALEQIEDAPDAQSASVALADGGQATAHWSAEVGQVVLVSDDLPTLADDETFELWYVRDAGAVSAGTFDAADGDATALLAGAMHTGDVIAVTVEPDGGSPTGAPTSDPILAIATA